MKKIFLKEGWLIAMGSKEPVQAQLWEEGKEKQILYGLGALWDSGGCLCQIRCRQMLQAKVKWNVGCDTFGL